MTAATTPPLRLAFAGTPAFAATILAALLELYPILAVYCQPPRPTGRGRKIIPSAVEELARQRGITVHTPRSMRDETANLKALRLDAFIVAAYGKLLPRDILSIPRYGCINVHASLLPRWRGAAPIERAMLAGDDLTGISIMQMDEGLDTGALLRQVECPIFSSDIGDTLHDRLAELGARTLIDCLAHLPRLRAQAQQSFGVTYAAKLGPADSLINWFASAQSVAAQIRALNSRQPTVCSVGGERVRLLFAQAIDWPAADHPGRIVRLDGHGLVITCGLGAVSISSLALARGKGKPMDIRSLLNGYPDLLKPGQSIDAAK